MKKKYICPEIEFVLAHLTKDLAELPGHSEGDADAKGLSFDIEDEDNENPTSRNLWDD
jgi:hypothetical protein